MTQKNNYNDDTDKKLRKLFQESALQAPPSPWFTRKVLNRLPERKLRAATYIEYALYITGIVLTGLHIISFIRHTAQGEVLTLGDATICGVLVSLLLSLCYMIIEPFVMKQD